MSRLLKALAASLTRPVDTGTIEIRRDAIISIDGRLDGLCNRVDALQDLIQEMQSMLELMQKLRPSERPPFCI